MNLSFQIYDISQFASSFCLLNDETGCLFNALNDVYHSESSEEMLVKADLNCVDLKDPKVLLWLTMQTAYHQAFWPHTAKRFNAFKNILRRRKDIREAIKTNDFKDILQKYFDAFANEYQANPLWQVPGKKKQLKNLKQMLDIVKKICDEKQ